MRSTRLRSSRSTLLPILLLIAAVVFWPALDSVQRQSTSAQSVSWLGPQSTSYLTSSGIPVWVPSWLPGGVSGVSPEIYAGGGSYSIYFHGGGNTFLYITGVAGAGFPGGSEANLNVELTVNASVQGYSAIRDIGIPQGSETPIYDKTMWIAGGVLYTVTGNGLDTDSLTLANSSVVIQPQAAPAPTSPPAAPPPSSGSGTSGSGSGSGSSGSSNQGTNTGTTSSATSSQSNSSGSSSGTTTGVVDESVSSSGGDDQPSAGGNDGTGGPWYSGVLSDVPSDGTAGPIPPRLVPSDGTGGPS